jgi:hypothetical protein
MANRPIIVFLAALEYREDKRESELKSLEGETDEI